MSTSYAYQDTLAMMHSFVSQVAQAMSTLRHVMHTCMGGGAGLGVVESVMFLRFFFAHCIVRDHVEN